MQINFKKHAAIFGKRTGECRKSIARLMSIEASHDLRTKRNKSGNSIFYGNGEINH